MGDRFSSHLTLLESYEVMIAWGQTVTQLLEEGGLYGTVG